MFLTVHACSYCGRESAWCLAARHGDQSDIARPEAVWICAWCANDARTPLRPQPKGARYKVSFTVSAETYAKLQEAQALLRHVIPNGDPALIFDRALTPLVAECARTKHAATTTPRPRRASTAPATPLDRARGTSAWVDDATPGTPAVRSRHIPAEVKRKVWARDGGQCAFVSPSGRRCAERGFLEFHHVVPYAKGGETAVEIAGALNCSSQTLGWRGAPRSARR
jgi:hypothetical protein